MFSLSSPPLALERKLKLSTTYTILLVMFLFTLYITSCEARRLRVNGKHSSSSKSSSSSQDAAEVANAQKKTRSSLMVHDAGKKARAAGSSIDQPTGAGATLINRSGGIRNTTHAARVSQQLPHRKHVDDQGIHLDYAQPRTRTPYHN
ncbi:hypothetical protein CFC21_093080 [Triticum aestivum]|uniref:Uncharacterized protein n=4 Tax=Triticinae TaxID=1648030 RepID=A0A453P8B7_AEGTS|nr:uncharacterized protein LOC109771510 [Aegilops tauschii subsp. strangulata]KAF7090316.1 hypothetical protein CFC21_093080 [Triticum aestivum]